MSPSIANPTPFIPLDNSRQSDFRNDYRYNKVPQTTKCIKIYLYSPKSKKLASNEKKIYPHTPITLRSSSRKKREKLRQYE